MPARSAAGSARCVELPFDRTAPALGRQTVADHAGPLTRAARDDAALLTSELVTNALRYGAPSIMLEVVVDGAGLVVRVGDHGPHMPRLPDTQPDAARMSGRGLLILDAIASRWGFEPFTVGPGKCVWFELP